MRSKLVVICFIFSLVSRVQAAAFTVGVPESDMYPLYKGAGSTFTGFSKDLLDEFARKYGHTFTYVALPINRLFISFSKKELDLKFPDDALLQPEIMKGKQVFYSNPALTVWQGVMVLPLREKGKSPASLSIVRGWVINEGMFAKDITLYESSSLENALRMVIIGHADGVWTNIQVGVYTLNNLVRTQDALVFDENLPVMPYHYSLSTMLHAKVIEQFNEFLLIEREGIVATIRARYGVREMLVRPVKR